MIKVLLERLKTNEACSKKEWKEVLRADPCSYCGESMSGTVDHIVPRSHLDEECNWDGFGGACQPCNNRKGDTPLIQFIHQEWIQNV